MEDAIYQRDNASLTFAIYLTSFLLVLHYKKNGKGLQLISKQLTRGCSSEKMKEDLSCSGLITDSLHIVQRILEQKPVLGIGVEFLELCSDSYILSCTSDTLLGSIVDDFFLLLPRSTSAVQFTLAIILLRVLGTPLSWKKLEFDKTIDWNGWSIQPATMIAQLPLSKQEKINSLIHSVLQTPRRKHLEKIIGILLWATSLVHHVRFLLTSLYRDLYSIPATNYSIPPTEWENFLNLLNDCATITTRNQLHLPVGSQVVEFKHSSITSTSQLPRDIPIERHAWIRLRDPNCEKRRLSDTSKETLLWSKQSLLPLLTSIPLNRSTQMTINAAADAFATDEEMGIGGWIQLDGRTFWFSQLWNKHDLQPFLHIPKCLQRYITSWEALAQLCIIFLVNRKCTTRPGIIDIQSGSDNTGAEANINHGFSNTEVLSDIIKLVSLQQIRCNIFLNIHHIPGQRNTDADDLSRGRISNFCPESRVLIQLVDIFNPLPFPRYINASVQWDLDIHANAKTFFCWFFSLSDHCDLASWTFVFLGGDLVCFSPCFLPCSHFRF